MYDNGGGCHGKGMGRAEAEGKCTCASGRAYIKHKATHRQRTGNTLVPTLGGVTWWRSVRSGMYERDSDTLE